MIHELDNLLMKERILFWFIKRIHGSLGINAHNFENLSIYQSYFPILKYLALTFAFKHF